MKARPTRCCSINAYVFAATASEQQCLLITLYEDKACLCDVAYENPHEKGQTERGMDDYKKHSHIIMGNSVCITIYAYT